MVEIEKRYVGVPDDTPDDEYEISIYEDEECTEEVKHIDFGPIKPGEEKYKWYWIKNTGRVPLPKVHIGMGVIDSHGWESIPDNYSGGPLDVGEKSIVAFRLEVASDVDTGKYSGNIPITVYGPEEIA